MKRCVIFILIIFNFSLLFAQKEAANWLFGEYAGLNFNSGSPIAQKGSLTTREGCASISNSSGQLLFYTDGTTVYNRNHAVMLNGSDLYGNNSSTQSAIIVPKPGTRNKFFIFTVDSAEKETQVEISNGLNYSEVDMNLDNGLGAVIDTKKNIHLVTYDENDPVQSNWKCSEKISAINNDDDTGYWVLTHFIDTFYAFKVDEFGVNPMPVETKTTETINIVDYQIPGSKFSNLSALGYLKYSPDGKKIAIAHSKTTKAETSGKVFLYDFDQLTGSTSTNGIQILGSTYPYGVEFSSKSKKLYVSASHYVTLRGNSSFEGSSIYQFDLTNPNIVSTKFEITKSSVLLAGALQLGLDGKIYRAMYNIDVFEGESRLGVINDPELLGNLCHYSDDGAVLAAGSKSNYGLPPFISSTFLFTFNFEFTCLGSKTHFFITSEEKYDSAIWDFGDGHTSTEDEPYHLYTSPGVYNVTLTTTLDGVQNDPVKKRVEIIELFDVRKTPYELVQCDLNDNDPNDGLSAFNLRDTYDPISLGNGNNISVYFYLNMEKLNEDITNTESLPEIYANTSRNQTLFAKIYMLNGDCYNVAQVVLKTSEAQNFVASPLVGCDDGSGMGSFNLLSHKNKLKEELEIGAISDISFYRSKEDASLGYNPLGDDLISGSTTIYFRAESEVSCYGVGKLDLVVPDFSTIDSKNKFTFCSSSFPLKLAAGVERSSLNNYRYKWTTGSNLSETQINSPGEYGVLITDIATGCTKYKTMVVERVDPPIILNIDIEDDINSYSALIEMDNPEKYVYAIDQEFGFYQEEPEFYNLNPGTYNLFVKDKFNCHITSKEFYIFGFPRFMTPNNDGLNDIWEVKGIDLKSFNYSEVLIFDRYGKLLTKMNVGDFWDGNYNGIELPSDDYWYTMTIGDKNNETKTYKGHFSIIRQ